MSQDKSARILVVVVTYNGASWLEWSLAPFRSDSEGIDIIVIDNASQDCTVELLEKEFPFIKLIKRSQNLGFGMANNLGLEWALVEGYEGVFLLNQDAMIQPSTIRRLAEVADNHPDIGILSPLHLSKDEKTLEEGFSNYLPQILPDTLFEVPFVNAALWYLPRRTLLEVGLFSPLFYHYGEDLDYTHRVRAKDLKVIVHPSFTGIHAREHGELTEEKRFTLTEAYHLAQFCNPLANSSFQRYYRGPIALWANGLKAMLKGKSGTPYWQAAKRLWKRRKEISLWLSHPELDIEGLKRTTHIVPKAPVLLLVYNRPKHTSRLLSHFWRQSEAEETPLYILSDGAKGGDENEVNSVRQICRDAAKHSHVTLWEQPTNVGLAQNVTEGVARVLEKHDRVIVLEDDLLLSPYFLRWMNDNLHMHQSELQIAHIHAGTFYTNSNLSPNHLLSFAGSWGWATWRDRWQSLWEPDGGKLLAQLEAMPEKKKRFDYGGFMRFSKMLRRQIEGKNNSWAIRWHASIFLHNRLSVNAHPPLASNDGFDGSGTHSSNDGRYSTPTSPYPLYATKYESVEEDKKARQELQKYYARTNNKLMKGLNKLRELLRK